MEAVVASLRITCKMAYPHYPKLTPTSQNPSKINCVYNLKIFSIVIIKEKYAY
jgi:hypothetical protein